MDIKEIIEMYGDSVDYYDFHTGYIYLISEWARLGKPDTGIRVVDESGNFIGVVRVK